jgi:hypothetical protein
MIFPGGGSGPSGISTDQVSESLLSLSAYELAHGIDNLESLLGGTDILCELMTVLFVPLVLKSPAYMVASCKSKEEGGGGGRAVVSLIRALSIGQEAAIMVTALSAVPRIDSQIPSTS